LIELNSVTKIYEGGVRAVENVSFTVKDGETLGLIGTSGCGKTTTLKMINRLVNSTDGFIELDGQRIDMLNVEELRRGIGYVIQHIGLFPHYDILDNVAVVPRLLKWDEDDIYQRCRELLQLVGLEPDAYAQRMPAELSGGQQQRVGLARALAADPPVVLLDEPFGALDPITREQVRKEFKKLQKQLKKTMVLVTHDVFEAFDLCDRICLMNKGRVQQIGSPKKLLFGPANEFTRSFFDAHRFQLEMKSITLRDTMGLLSESVGRSEQGITFSAGQSMLEVMEMIEGTESEVQFITITNDDSSEDRKIAVDQLLPLFYRVKKELQKKFASHG